MNLAIAVICTGIGAALMGCTAGEVTIAQVIVLVVYIAGAWIIDIAVSRGPTDRNKPY